ncbi:MAG: hypothetical protein WKF36_07760 [Candidatus Nitrosocosmicus sp.]
MVTDFIVKIGIILTLKLEVMNHMQQKIHRQAFPGINFLGCHKISFADNFSISEIGTAKNWAPIVNAKGLNRAKSLDNVQQPVKSLHYRSMHKSLTFTVRDIAMD